MIGPVISGYQTWESKKLTQVIILYVANNKIEQCNYKSINA